MQTFSSFLLGLALLASCGSKSSIDEMKESRDRLCACKDSACLQKESNTFASFKTKLQEMNDKDLESALMVTQEGLACAATLASDLIPGAE
jgi:hypothetical protein